MCVFNLSTNIKTHHLIIFQAHHHSSPRPSPPFFPSKKERGKKTIRRVGNCELRSFLAMAGPKFVWVIVLGLALGVVCSVPKAEAVRAFFVFGDSLVDNGNNNFLATTARADSPPYGIDYPTHRPTGRFSNGYNIPDLISQNIGAETTLPYLSPQLTGQRLLVGANFASAGIGILNDTGIQFVNIIRIAQQFLYFQQYQQRLTALVGSAQANRLVSQALVLITLGGNDFVNNYFLVPYSARSRQYNLPDYVRFVISEYQKVLQRLYDLGARRVLVTGTGPLGCVPAELAMRGSRNGECIPELQRAAALFNPQMIQIINNLNRRIGSNVFVAVNARESHNDFISNPQAYGFVTSKIACCGQGPYNGLGLCTAASNLCPNRDLYAFWDPFHPSERANRYIVQTIMSGSTRYMYPMNLSTIMALDSMA
ncbi:GDSL esterase/lipase At5g33370-like [Rhododendron vialii]|uniref:GDSL esterase/lipase At5g33370-like n=1 Tax=Rhododendron vialii TaxID=182163 RepID=UPI0026605090|nr:GDSL esterase/lipase At5g33370-like [Rhododendron vialii]